MSSQQQQQQQAQQSDFSPAQQVQQSAGGITSVTGMNAMHDATKPVEATHVPHQTQSNEEFFTGLRPEPGREQSGFQQQQQGGGFGHQAVRLVQHEQLTGSAYQQTDLASGGYTAGMPEYQKQLEHARGTAATGGSSTTTGEKHESPVSLREAVGASSVISGVAASLPPEQQQTLRTRGQAETNEGSPAATEAAAVVSVAASQRPVDIHDRAEAIHKFLKKEEKIEHKEVKDRDHVEHKAEKRLDKILHEEEKKREKLLMKEEKSEHYAGPLPVAGVQDITPEDESESSTSLDQQPQQNTQFQQAVGGITSLSGVAALHEVTHIPQDISPQQHSQGLTGEGQRQLQEGHVITSPQHPPEGTLPQRGLQQDAAAKDLTSTLPRDEPVSFTPGFASAGGMGAAQPPAEDERVTGSNPLEGGDEQVDETLPEQVPEGTLNPILQDAPALPGVATEPPAAPPQGVWQQGQLHQDDLDKVSTTSTAGESNKASQQELEGQTAQQQALRG